jgi:hypothetical protein
MNKKIPDPICKAICMYMIFIQEPTPQIIESARRNEKPSKNRGTDTSRGDPGSPSPDPCPAQIRKWLGVIW